MADLPAEGVDIDAELLRFEQLVDKSDPEQMVASTPPFALKRCGGRAGETGIRPALTRAPPPDRSFWRR